MYNDHDRRRSPLWVMRQFTSWEVAQKDNKWQGRNITRWRNEEYDRPTGRPPRPRWTR